MVLEKAILHSLVFLSGNQAFDLLSSEYLSNEKAMDIA